MSTTSQSTPHSTHRNARFVEPEVFAEQMLSRETLERHDQVEDGVLGLRNLATGETFFVRASGFRAWLRTHP
ncbi:MAG: hypothetical protein KDA75_19790 [Planctomycetaceae bacterium]|nr:hypothetical protein [Planctomycetaceae bacterium]